MENRIESCSAAFDINEEIKAAISTSRDNYLQEFLNKEDIYKQRFQEDMKINKRYDIMKRKRKYLHFDDYCDDEYLNNCNNINITKDIEDLDEYVELVNDWRDAAIEAWELFAKWQTKIDTVLEDAYVEHYTMSVAYKNKESTVHPGRQRDFIINYIKDVFKC